MTVTINGTTGIANDGGYTGDGVVFADTTPANTLVTTTGGNVGIGTSSPGRPLHVASSSTSYLARFQNSGSALALINFKDNTTSDFNVGVGANGENFVAYTSNTERARIDSSGNLLVGTTSTNGSERLNVTGSVANNIARFINSNAAPYGPLVQYPTGVDPNNTSNEFIDCRANATTARFNVRSNGGVVNYSANNVNLSDRREKTNFAPAKSYIETICAIPVQTFNYIDQNMEEDPGLTLGVVAQDVQAVAPELVMESNWGTEEDPKMRLSIYQTDLQYALMKCIQEQQAIINAQQAALTALTARVTALDTRLTSLEGTQP